MKINDILKKENAGKVYKITNGEYEGEAVFITEYLTVEITLNGRTGDIEDVICLIDILDLEFEEEKPYKEISGREAIDIILDGGIIYKDKELNYAYTISESKLVYKNVYEVFQESNMSFSRVLRIKWYIKN